MRRRGSRSLARLRSLRCARMATHLACYCVSFPAHFLRCLGGYGIAHFDVHFFLHPWTPERRSEIQFAAGGHGDELFHVLPPPEYVARVWL